MKNKNLLIILLAVLAISLLSTSTVLAGGWHKLGPTEGNTGGITSPTDPNVNDIGKFDEDGGLFTTESEGNALRVPHLNLQTSSNKCRTCHAVHNADNTATGLSGAAKNMGDSPNLPGTGNNFKLLRNETRATECNFCHGPKGALSNPVKKPYGDMLDTNGNAISAKGQHTLGATAIPDSTVDPSSNSIATDGLSCGNCHSVHGGWTLNGITGAGILSTRLLRRDPANNGNGSDGQGAGGGVINVADQGNGNKAVLGAVPAGQFTEGQYLAGFCGDCHNKNVSWDRGGSGAEGDSVTTASEGERPNKAAHPLGNTDGLIDVYGKLGRVEDDKIANWIKGKDASGTNIPGAHVDSVLACDDCHKSRRQQSELASSDPAPAGANTTQYGKSKFPHQSVGHKLLSDSFNDASTVAGFDYTGDPNRALPNLDAKVCRTCHGDVGGTFKGVGNAGNVNTF